jgi:hypothetical protein
VGGETTVSYWQVRREEKQVRPRLRWMDDIEMDLRNMGEKIWRTKALHRTEWKSVVTEAKVKRKGL